MRKFMTVAFLAAGLLCGCPEAGKTDAPKTTADAPKTTADAPKTTGDAGKPAAEENFWKTVNPGTTLEYAMVMNYGTEMKSTQKQTLKSKDDKGYILSTETPPAPATDMPMVPWTAPAADPKAPAPKVENLADEDVKVGGDTFKCKHIKTTDEANKTVSETWTSKGLMVKMTSKSDGAAKGSMEMTLTKIEKK